MKFFSKTWGGDLPWMELALKSVSYFCREPVDWTIVVEQESEAALRDILQKLRLWHVNHRITVKVITTKSLWPEATQMQGYMGQQWVKLNAHRGINGLFWNWDSDVIAQRPFDHTSFIGPSGRPIYWFSHFNSLMIPGGADNAAHEQRRAVMKQIFRFDDIAFELMRCMPIAMNSDICEHGSRHRIWEESKDKLMRGDRSFSEFNIYGQFAMFFFPDAYEWRNAEAQPPTWAGGYKEGGHGSGNLDGISIVTQCYSWGGVPRHIYDYVNSLPVEK